MINRKCLISVIGGHKNDGSTEELAERVGEIIAAEGAVLVTGGLGGIMKAASKGAKKAGGLTIGIIPGENRQDANEFVDIVITSGMGYSRNALVAGTADIVIALKGEYGTLSEIGFALTGEKPVYGLNSWDIPGIKPLKSPENLKEILRKSELI